MISNPHQIQKHLMKNHTAVVLFHGMTGRPLNITDMVLLVQALFLCTMPTFLGLAENPFEMRKYRDRWKHIYSESLHQINTLGSDGANANQSSVVWRRIYSGPALVESLGYQDLMWRSRIEISEERSFCVKHGRIFVATFRASGVRSYPFSENFISSVLHAHYLCTENEKIRFSEGFYGFTGSRFNLWISLLNMVNWFIFLVHYIFETDHELDRRVNTWATELQF